MTDARMAEQMATKKGFIAALDQSGGSTPKALRLYGVAEDAWSTDEEMFGLIHEMRTRIVKAPAFTGEKVIGAILFERTMDGEINGVPTATYLWETRGVVPFLKVDKGLADVENGVRLMKPMPDLDALLTRAVSKGIFGTKMRSVIDAANPQGIAANVAQQFEIAHQILSHGLMPIIEPEVTITISDKAEAEDMLRDEILKHLDEVPADKQVMLKLSLPTRANQYADLMAHPRVMRVVALSGGYSRADANEKLCENTGMIASFSRALTEGLSAGQADADFNQTIAETIDCIYDASCAGQAGA
ncbi:MAG: fructose bisphosphate aldolase [Pseudomonadota bacterium]